jgi:hypothetical protein
MKYIVLRKLTKEPASRNTFCSKNSLDKHIYTHKQQLNIKHKNNIYIPTNTLHNYNMYL